MAQRLLNAALGEEMLQLRPGGALRRAQQAGDRKGAAGIGPGAAGFQRLAAQPAAQEAGHEGVARAKHVVDLDWKRSEEHTSELQSLMRISYAVFCLKKKTTTQINSTINITN